MPFEGYDFSPNFYSPCDKVGMGGIGVASDVQTSAFSFPELNPSMDFFFDIFNTHIS